MSAGAGPGGSAKRATAGNREHRDTALPSRQELVRRLERVEQEKERLREQLAERDRQHAEDQRQIAELERQLATYRKDSSNSSKPPSTDRGKKDSKEDGKRRYPLRKKSKRKPGGQQGTPANIVLWRLRSGSIRSWWWTPRPVGTAGTHCRRPAIRAMKPKATCSAIK